MSLIESPILQFELCPNRRVIGRLFPFSRFAIDSGITAFFCEGLTGKNRVDAQAAIFWKCKHRVIPPTEKTGLLSMQAQGVAQPMPQSWPNAARWPSETHDCTAPKFWIVCIPVFRMMLKSLPTTRSRSFSFVRQSRDRAYQFSLYSYAGDPTA